MKIVLLLFLLPIIITAVIDCPSDRLANRPCCSVPNDIFQLCKEFQSAIGQCASLYSIQSIDACAVCATPKSKFNLGAITRTFRGTTTTYPNYGEYYKYLYAQCSVYYDTLSCFNNFFGTLQDEQFYLDDKDQWSILANAYSTESCRSSSSSDNKALIIGICAGVGGVILLVAVVFLYLHRRRHSKITDTPTHNTIVVV
jgi:hypothetical protein